jgi:hypothetical protein
MQFLNYYFARVTAHNFPKPCHGKINYFDKFALPHALQTLILLTTATIFTLSIPRVYDISSQSEYTCDVYDAGDKPLNIQKS